jgi:ribosomal protein L37AE/L43A
LQTEASQIETKGELTRPCPACGRTTQQAFRFRVNGCDILQCHACGLGRTETPAFDPATYYTEDYFSGGRADGYSDYLGAEPVLRRFHAPVPYRRQAA